MTDFGKPDTYSFQGVTNDRLEAMTDTELDAYNSRLRGHIERINFAISNAENPHKIERAQELLPMVNDEMGRVYEIKRKRRPYIPEGE